MSASSVRRDFYALNTYFQQQVQPNRAALDTEKEIDLENLENYLSQINPSNPHFATLAEFYKNELIDRIETIFAAVVKKLHPPSHSSELRKQYTEVQALMTKSRSGTLTKKDVLTKKEDVRIDDRLRKRILEAVWVVSGSPQGDLRFAENKLGEGIGILTSKFCPWFS